MQNAHLQNAITSINKRIYHLIPLTYSNLTMINTIDTDIKPFKLHYVSDKTYIM